MAVSISMGVIAADNIATGVTQIKQNKPMLTYGAQVIKWTGLAPEGYEEMIYGFVDLSLSSKAYMISKSVPSTVKIVMMAKSTDAPNILKNARIMIDNFMPNSMKNRHRIGYKSVDETKLTQVESTTIKESTGSKLASNLEEQASEIIKPVDSVLNGVSQSGTITKVEGVVSDVGEAGKITNVVKPTVTAELEVNGVKFKDTNQTARPLDKANADESTLIVDRVTLKEQALIDKGKTNNLPLPNSNMANAHAEIGAIQQAHNAGLAKGADLKITVSGKDVCNYCKGDIAAAAQASGAKSVTITAFDQYTGITRRYQWKPGMKSIQEVK